MIKLSRIMIAGTNSGVGKTMVTLGIMSALVKKGMKVQGFKAGPDYIDPSHHNFVTGNTSRNLDTWIMADGVCRELFERSAFNADVSVIEGVMGLYDGSIDSTGQGSSAHLAKVLNTPVILVVNAKGIAQSAGALVKGYKEYDKEVKLSGVILNNVASYSHYECIKKSIEDTCSIPVLGYLEKDKEITIDERHLGLVPFTEGGSSSALYTRLGEMTLKTADIDGLLKIAHSADKLPDYDKSIFLNDESKLDVQIAIAKDEAFCFYYQDDIELFEILGAKINYFSPLKDKCIPDDVDGIFIGGGFPELYAERLMDNKSMRSSILNASRMGKIIYGECGGMMYLLEKLIDSNGKPFEMCGVLKGTSKMENKKQGLGYVIVDVLYDNPICKRGGSFRAHEFHWSKLQNIPKDTVFAYKTKKSNGQQYKFDGMCRKNILTSYTHVHFSSNLELAKNLLLSMSEVSRCKIDASVF
ncbi:MAG: cobyrinic acid a,c-diamide synthase [Candidatus Scalindua rubra]|uniref:Cobyrinate a,c-diamide synthase n=1 Tax=Candidatus Scalindua rubra TaxID=1872076 RepID=A0A1E3XGA1_9BACT|nr:MAG: cobyrinic acid a,c-diamide synthase [Candidatus Scalindua rubra]